MTAIHKRHYLSTLVGATLTTAVLLGACKMPGKKKVPPIKITSIEAKAEVKDQQRLLKISYRAVNIKNNCSGGLCVATLLTKISVYGPKGGRIRVAKKHSRNRLDHKETKEMTGGQFWFTVPLPGDAPAGTYTLRIEADDKLRKKWDVKKVKVKVPAEPIPTIRIEKVTTTLALFKGTRVIKLSYHATDVYNRCRESLCKASYTTRVQVIRPDGKPHILAKDALSNTLEHSGESRSSGGSFSFRIPIWGKKMVGKWTLKIELTDTLSKKTATQTVKVDVQKQKKK